MGHKKTPLPHRFSSTARRSRPLLLRPPRPAGLQRGNETDQATGEVQSTGRVVRLGVRGQSPRRRSRIYPSPLGLKLERQTLLIDRIQPEYSRKLESIQELALGLELAGVRFLWALRKPADTNNDDDELLPCGVICMEWVPQTEALAHGATGAFLTHCGWGSTLESFAFGLPLVMLPFIIDTPMIARAMAKRGIGVEVARERDDSDGSFSRDGIAAAVRRVMVEEQGKAIATNARKLQELLADDGRQEQYIDELLDHLRRYKDE